MILRSSLNTELAGTPNSVAILRPLNPAALIARISFRYALMMDGLPNTTPLATPKAALVRAILEGTAFALRHNVDVARAAGVEFTEIRSVGGGTRSALWNQIKADVLGLPVLLPETSVGAPFGDAVLVGMGLGIYPDVSATLRDIVRVRTRYEPDMQAHQRYTQLYGVFRSIYDHLRPDFDQLAVINEQ